MPVLHVVVSVDLPEDLGSFQEAEAKIQKAVFQGGRSLLQKLMDHYEQKVVETKSFWVKDRRPKTYETLVGKFRRERIRVFDHQQKKLRYPLDAWMGLSSYRRATPGLTDAIVETAVEHSYRKTAFQIERLTGVKKEAMSHWKVVQDMAGALRKKEKPVPDWFRKPLPFFPGNDPCPILAIDPDGTYCHNQRKEEKDHDVKVAVLYTGKTPDDKKGKRFRLENKQVLFSRSQESISDFFSRVTHTAMSHYGAHRDTLIVCHGDGDAWIKGLKSNYWEKTLLRLDPWHVKKKIILATGLKEIPKRWERAIYGNPDRLIAQIAVWKVKHTSPRSKQREKIEELIGYLRNNREGLLPSGIDAETKEKYPGMFKRGSGTIESNIGHAFNARFKQPRMSWSTQGLDNLSYLREKYLNRHMTLKYHVPQPLTRNWIAEKSGRLLH